MTPSPALPPAARGVPFFGNALSYLRDPLGFLREMRIRHGDFVRVALGPMKIILLGHPDDVEDVLVTRNKLWQKDQQFMEKMRPVLGDGLLSSEGDFWRRQRRLAQPAFHRERTEGYATIMVRHAARLASRWRDGEVRDVHQDMMRLTLEIVAEALFGADVGAHADEVGEALEYFFLGGGECFFRLRRRHEIIFILRLHALDDAAGLRFAWRNRLHVDRRLSDIQPQIGFAMIFVRAVTGEAVVTEDRAVSRL